VLCMPMSVTFGPSCPAHHAQAHITAVALRSVGPQAPPNTKCCSSTAGRALAACPRHVVSICGAALPILALQLNNYCPSCTRKHRRRPNKPPPAPRGCCTTTTLLNAPHRKRRGCDCKSPLHFTSNSWVYKQKIGLHSNPSTSGVKLFLNLMSRLK
jgi:hypothetical protein